MQLINSFFKLLFTPERVILYGQKLAAIVLISCLVYVVYKLITITINRVFARRVHEKHIEMLIALFKSTLIYITLFILLVTILQEMGIDLTAILASAGVVGLAVSFGAQSLVKDMLAGIFIIIENQFAIGDEVVIYNNVGKNEVKGKVREINIRTTVIEDESGTKYIVPNGNIACVANLKK